MKDYARIIGKITTTPWMITPDALKMMLEIFDAHLSGTLTHEEIQARTADRDSRPSVIRRSGQVGVLSLTGPIFPKANLMTEMSGATSVEQFRSEFREMMADDGISSILLDIDSPGGLSDQIDEMATEIREARESKPIYAIANTAANSAAYYLASQATKMYATPSGQLGSIGVYIVHVDDTRRKDAMGIDKTVIKTGRFKALADEPLTADGKSHLQDHVNETNDQFIQAVALGRNLDPKIVREKFGEGGVVQPRYALANGMIDEIATFDQVVESITQNTGGGSVAIAATGRLAARASYDADKEHSEPGTGLGGEPTPREPPEEGDPAIVGGWRRDPPPIAFEEEEEEAVNRQWLEDRATALGIEFSDETTDDDLATAVAERMDGIVTPLAEATADAQRARDFARDYPEQAAQLQASLQRDRQISAREFADGYRTFEDDGSHGFSPVVREQLASAHLGVAERTFTHEQLTELVNSMASRTSVVPLGERGSGREGEPTTTVRPGATVHEIRTQFGDLVRNAMTEDELSQEAAIEHVSKQNPELAAAYLASK